MSVMTSRHWCWKGESSAFLVIQEDSDATLLGVQKAENGWKIERMFQLFRVKTVFTDGCIVSLYRFGGSEDYYVIANKVNGGEKNVADNRSSDFQTIAVSHKALDQIDTTYYAYVYQPGEGYAVTIDGITVHVT